MTSRKKKFLNSPLRIQLVSDYLKNIFFLLRIIILQLVLLMSRTHYTVQYIYVFYQTLIRQLQKRQMTNAATLNYRDLKPLWSSLLETLCLPCCLSPPWFLSHPSLTDSSKSGNSH